jgi:hypothetical protein
MVKRTISLVTLLVVAWVGTPAPAATQHVWDSDRPDAHAPLGVPYGHLLEGRQIMIGYRYDYARFEGLRDGTNRATTEDVFGPGYALAPRQMNTHLHLIEAMYGAGDRLTVIAEIPWFHANLTMERRTGPDTEMSASGLGDVRIGGLFGILDRPARRVHAGLMIGFPTGGTDERDEAGNAPYAMQPGSGTFSLSPTVTFVEQRDLWSWGAQVGGGLFLGEGSDGWAPGNRLDTSAWFSRRLMPWATGSVRLAGEFRGDVRDDVPEFPASPASEPGLTGGTRVELVAGANLHAAAGIFLGHRLFGELAIPVYQNLHGPQLGMQWRGILGWRWTLGGG